MNLFSNGWLVQDTSCYILKTNNFIYNGVNAFDSYPLMRINDKECISLSDEQTIKFVENNEYQILEFISKKDLLRRYVHMCKIKNIKYRILFVQSDYSKEICSDPFYNNLHFLGYEYCCIPIDEQIITDLDWCGQLQCFRSRINKNGLFDNYKDVIEFKEAYDLLFKEGKIGDGEFDGFIMKIWEMREI